ncbi:MAG: YcgL domain-containing protein [Methylosarcina sp.]
MHCYIYKSSKKQNLYLYIRNKDDFSSVPEALFNSLGKLELIIELELTPERKLAKEDSVKVIASLNQKGYFLQLPATDVPPPLQLQ